MIVSIPAFYIKINTFIYSNIFYFDVYMSYRWFYFIPRECIKKIQFNTVTSLQCCSLCDNLDSRYLYTCMAVERGRGGR